MEKSQASYYLSRIYRLMRGEELPVLLKRLRGQNQKEKHGKTDYETISLNPKFSLLPTFVHECLHNFHPNLCESKIGDLENQIFSKLTIRQLNNLLLRLALAINRIPQP